MTRPATATRRPPALRIRAAAAADEAEILIYDDIGASYYGEGVDARQFVEDLNGIDASTLHVRINSAGGQVFEGLSIFNALQRHPARVITHIDGLAASIASVIALAGDEVRIAENAFLMIHDPHGMAVGNAADMRQMAETLDKVGESLLGIYTRRTLAEQKRIRAWMAAETWFDAEDALRERFVDAISDPKDAAAAVDLGGFRNVPNRLAARVRRLGQNGGPLSDPGVLALEFAELEARIAREDVARESAVVLARAGRLSDRYDVEWEPHGNLEEHARAFVQWAAHFAGREPGQPLPVVKFYRPKRDGQPMAFTIPGGDEVAISTANPPERLPYVVAHEVAHVFEPAGLSREEAEARAHRLALQAEREWWRRH